MTFVCVAIIILELYIKFRRRSFNIGITTLWWISDLIYFATDYQVMTKSRFMKRLHRCYSSRAPGLTSGLQVTLYGWCHSDSGVSVLLYSTYTGCFIISVTLSLTYIFIKFELKEQYIYIYHMKELSFFQYKYRTYLHFDLLIMTSILTSLYFDMEMTIDNCADIVKLKYE